MRAGTSGVFFELGLFGGGWGKASLVLDTYIYISYHSHPFLEWFVPNEAPLCMCVVQHKSESQYRHGSTTNWYV